MESRHLRMILRHAAAVAGQTASGQAKDVELLARFRDRRDEAAFAELVNRYGRLVWAVCRNLLCTEVDAADSFQAVFLALVQHSDRIRDGSKLGPWLHGVAFRVCSKVRRQASRRKARERAAARHENGQDVPDSAWDSAMAAVHEEVSLLPESLRVPFVLCCLEGKGATEAAAQLGWKLGTLSGRLTRAKNRLLTRLDKRGLATGAAALAIGASASAGVPHRILQRASGLICDGSAIPSTILHLSQGAIGMTAYRTKFMVVGVLLAALGLTTGAGSGWLAKAGAQPDGKDRAALQDAVAEEVEGLTELAKAVRSAERKSPWEFKFEPLAQGSAPEGVADTTKRLSAAAAAGWEYSGTTEMTLTPEEYARLAETKGAKPSAAAVYRVYIYKRPVATQTSDDDIKRSRELFRAIEMANRDAAKRAKADMIDEKGANAQKERDAAAAKRKAAAFDEAKKVDADLAKLDALAAEKKAAAADVKRLQADKYALDLAEQIKQLQAELDALKSKSKAADSVKVHPDKASETLVHKLTSPALDWDEMVRVLESGAAKKFGKDALRAVPDPKSRTIMLSGRLEAIKWASELIRKLEE